MAGISQKRACRPVFIWSACGPSSPFLKEVMARLSGGFNDVQDRQPLAFECECTAAISETGVVGDVVVGAVVAVRALLVRFRRHGIIMLESCLMENGYG